MPLGNSLANSLASSLGNSLNGGGAAPVANAGVDASHNRFYGAAYTLAGSATGPGPITYEWSKVSGTPVPTFTDDTDPLTTVTFDVAGAVVLRLTATNAYGVSSDDVTITATDVGLLDGLSAAPNGLWCRSARLRSAYTGALTRVRRASDSTAQDVPYLASNALADSAGMATFCGANNGFETTVYDQSGNARPLAQGTAGLQSKLHDSATGPNLMAGDLAAGYDNTDDATSRADTCGITAANAITLWAVWSTARTTGFPRPLNLQGGAGGAGQKFEVYMDNDTTHLAVNIGGATRKFLCGTALNAGVNVVVVSIGAGAGIGTATCMMNGVALSESSVSNPANTISLLGALVQQGNHASYSPLNGNVDACGVWASALSAGDVAILNAASTQLHGVP